MPSRCHPIYHATLTLMAVNVLGWGMFDSQLKLVFLLQTGVHGASVMT